MYLFLRYVAIAIGIFVFQQIDQSVIPVEFFAAIALYSLQPVGHQRLEVNRRSLALGNLCLHHIGGTAARQSENQSHQTFLVAQFGVALNLLVGVLHHSRNRLDFFQPLVHPIEQVQHPHGTAIAIQKRVDRLELVVQPIAL